MTPEDVQKELERRKAIAEDYLHSGQPRGGHPPTDSAPDAAETPDPIVHETTATGSEAASGADIPSTAVLMRELAQAEAQNRLLTQKLDGMQSVIEQLSESVDAMSAPLDEKTNHEPRETIRIDLPPIGGLAIRLNGLEYYHGQTYTVAQSVAAVLREQMNRARGHDANVFGRNENFYRQATNEILRPR